MVSRMKKKEIIKQKWCRLYPYIAYTELTDLNKYLVLLPKMQNRIFVFNLMLINILHYTASTMSIHGDGDSSISVVSIKTCKASCYFDTSHMSTPLPVTSAFDTVMDFPV